MWTSCTLSYTSLEPSQSTSAQHAALPEGLHVLLGCESNVRLRRYTCECIIQLADADTYKPVFISQSAARHLIMCLQVHLT